MMIAMLGAIVCGACGVIATMFNHWTCIICFPAFFFCLMIAFVCEQDLKDRIAKLEKGGKQE